MGTLHREPNAFFESMSLCLLTPVMRAHWGYYGSKAIPLIHFAAVNNLTKDDATISYFKQ
jgi:hypothetical protein